MNKIKIQNIEFDTPENWSEVPFYKAIEIMNLTANIDKYVKEQFLIEICALILNVNVSFLYGADLTDDEVSLLLDMMKPFMVAYEPVDNKLFNIDGVLYSYENIFKLTFGENISLKVLEKNSKSEYEYMLNILSILLRPVKEEKTDEFGEKVYIVEKFDGDIETLNKRKELFKNIPSTNALYIVQNFINGKVI
jgi:hypothetical protein